MKVKFWKDAWENMKSNRLVWYWMGRSQKIGAMKVPPGSMTWACWRAFALAKMPKSPCKICVLVTQTEGHRRFYWHAVFLAQDAPTPMWIFLSIYELLRREKLCISSSHGKLHGNWCVIWGSSTNDSLDSMKKYKNVLDQVMWRNRVIFQQMVIQLMISWRERHKLQLPIWHNSSTWGFSFWPLESPLQYISRHQSL